MSTWTLRSLRPLALPYRPSTAFAIRPICTFSPRLASSKEHEEIKFDLPQYVNEPGGAAHVPKIRSRVVREIPPLRSDNLKYALMFGGMCAFWAVYTLYLHNRERATSTGFRYATRCVRDNELAQHTLGGNVRLEPSIVGDPWISGTINVLQGKIDISFRVTGNLRGGTVYFTSIRRDKTAKFEVIRFSLVPDRKGKSGSLDDVEHVVSLLGPDGMVMED